MLHTSDDFNRPMLQYRRADCKSAWQREDSALRRRRPRLGLRRAALGLQRDRGFADHLDQRLQRFRTPSPVTAEISSGVFFAARFSRSFCFFNSSGVTASILFSATISILSARCPS